MKTATTSSAGTIRLRYETLRNLTSPEEKANGAKSYFANVPVVELLKLDTAENLRGYIPDHPGKKRGEENGSARGVGKCGHRGGGRPVADRRTGYTRALTFNQPTPRAGGIARPRDSAGARRGHRRWRCGRRGRGAGRAWRRLPENRRAARRVRRQCDRSRR